MLKLIILISIYIIQSNAINIEDEQKHFITPEEYGQLLYLNPRGIGCHFCHGKNGESKFIASYKAIDPVTNKLKKYSIITPNIQNMDYKVFKNYINNTKSDSIMPKYFLTEKELQSLYIFLNDSI